MGGGGGWGGGLPHLGGHLPSSCKGSETQKGVHVEPLKKGGFETFL